MEPSLWLPSVTELPTEMRSEIGSGQIGRDKTEEATRITTLSNGTSVNTSLTSAGPGTVARWKARSFLEAASLYEPPWQKPTASGTPGAGWS